MSCFPQCDGQYTKALRLGWDDCTVYTLLFETFAGCDAEYDDTTWAARVRDCESQCARAYYNMLSRSSESTRQSHGKSSGVHHT